MTITADLPTIPRLALNVAVRPESVSHPELKARAEKMRAAREAATQALAEHRRLESQQLDHAARHADAAAIAAAATDDGYTDPGTPNATGLAEQRAAAHRKAYALAVRANHITGEWLAYLRDHYDEIVAYIDRSRAPAAHKVAAALTKALPDVQTVHRYDAEIAWLDKAAHTPTGPGPIPYHVPPSPRADDSPILGNVEALLRSLEPTDVSLEGIA